MTLETPIRYGSNDPVEVWLYRLLCLDAKVKLCRDKLPYEGSYRKNKLLHCCFCPRSGCAVFVSLRHGTVRLAFSIFIVTFPAKLSVLSSAFHFPFSVATFVSPCCVFRARVPLCVASVCVDSLVAPLSCFFSRGAICLYGVGSTLFGIILSPVGSARVRACVLGSSYRYSGFACSLS